MSAIWSLTGGKRTSRRQPNSVAIDLGRTSSNQREELEPRSVRNSLRRLAKQLARSFRMRGR